MKNKSRLADTRMIPAFKGNKWRFVRTKRGEQYCVEWLLLTKKQVVELLCYRFDEYGEMFSVRLKPEEVQDMSEISELLSLN